MKLRVRQDSDDDPDELRNDTAPPGGRRGDTTWRLKHAVRDTIATLPGGESLVKRYKRFHEHRRLARLGDARQVFNHHYQVNYWGETETVSGPGSTVRCTESIRKAIPVLVRDLGVSVILDAPCGDFNWFRLIEWETEVSYIGGDIVTPLVERNRSLYGSTDRTFMQLNILQDDLPGADLWLCRDCLCHLSNRDAGLAIANFLRSDIRFLLVSTHPRCSRNRDIPTGAFRATNLALPPFSFCMPTRVIDDWVDGETEKRLALWDREALRHCLTSNSAFRRIAQD